MANALQYIANLGKSVTYSAIDQIKDMNPVISEFAEQNSELGKILYESVKDFKGTARKAYSYVKDSKVGEFGHEYYKALMEDIKSGKLYNRERIDQMTIRASGNLLSDFGDDDPFADMDSSFDGGDSSFDFNESDWDLDDSDKFMADQIDRVGEKTANAVAVATGRSADYIVKGNKAAMNALQKHNEYLFGKVNIGIGAVNSSIAGLIEFNEKVIKPHVENSKTFFETTNKLDAERNELLKKLVDIQTNMYKSSVPETKKSSNVKYNDIVSGYSPDLKMYGKRVMQNVNSMAGGYLDMNNMFEGGNMLLTFAGSPLKFLTDNLIKKMTPKMIENSMKDLNETLSGFFGSLMSKFNSMRDDELGIGKFIADIFGIDPGTKTKIDPSRYNKGAIPFDGETKMAITQVIPMHLAKIEAALTGQTERFFDYKKGTFIDLNKIKDEYKGISKTYSDRASSDLRSEMEGLLKTVRFKDVKDAKKLREQMSNMFEKSYNEGTLVNFNKKDLSPSDLGIDNYRDFHLIRNLMKEVKKSTKMKYNSKVWEQKSAQDRFMEAQEADPTSIYRIMESGFDINQYSNRRKDGRYIGVNDVETGKNKTPGLKNNLVIVKDNFGNNVFHYLQRMTEDIEKIRFRFLSGGGNSPSNSGIVLPGSYSGKIDIKNPSPLGIKKAVNFKLDSEIQRELEDREQAAYDREMVRMREKNTKFDYGNNKSYDKSSKKIKSGPWTEEEWIESQRRAAKKLPNYDEQVFIEAAQKVAKKRVNELNKRNSYTKGYLLDEADYDDLDDEEFSDVFRTHLRADKGYQKEMKGIDEQLADTKKNTLGRRIKKKLMDSDKVADGFKNLMMGLDDLSQKPVKTIANILNRVDERLYQVIYGDDGDGDGKLSPKSFMGAMMAKMTASFNSFTQFMKDDIFTPFKEMLGGKDIKGHVKDLGNRLLEWMGIDTSKFKGKAKTFAKDMFKRPLDFVQDAFTGVARPIYKELHGETKDSYNDFYKNEIKNNNDRVKKYASNNALAFLNEGLKDGGVFAERTRSNITKEGRLDLARRYASGVGQVVTDKASLKAIARHLEKQDPNIVKRYADGSRMIRKSGLAVLSEGEMVIPSELNPLYNKTTNKRNQRRNESRIRDSFINKMKNRIPMFSDGNDNYDPSSGSFNPKDDVNISKRNKKAGEVEYDEDYADLSRYKDGKDPLTAKVAKVGEDTTTSILKRLGLAGQKFKDKLKLKTKMEAVGKKLDDIAGADNSDELFNAAVKDVTGNFADYIPGVLGGGLLGSGVSLITGAIGGPLIGAAVGAAIGLTTQSDKVKNWLFGEMDENGERKGNVISKDLSNNIKKYFPNMAKGATVGGITSILPFVPGGPVAGIIIGSSIGFATKSEKVQSMLFGDIIDDETGERNNRGLLKPEFIKNLKGSIPEMVLGSGVGILAGPFGLVGNIALGASLGYLSKTKKFQEALFGKEVTDPETGEIKHEGGILGTIEKKFVNPIVDSIQPIGKQLQLGVKGIFDGLNGIFHSVFDEELRIPLRKFFKEKIFDRAVAATSKVGKALINPALQVASSPFRMVGAVGEHFRERQIANGNADYMTAQERLDFRNKRKQKGKSKLFGRTFNRGKISKDNFDDFDQMLVDMGSDELGQVKNAIDFLENPTESADTQRSQSISKINNAINYDYGLDYSTSKKILKHLRNDDADKAFEVIRRSGLDPEKQRKLSMLISQEHANYMSANTVKAGVKERKNNVYGKLQKLGLKDINDNTLGKYKKLVNQEISIKKSPEEWKDTQDQKRHEEVVDLFKELIANIKDITHPGNKNVEQLKRSRFKANMLEASKKRGFIGRFDSGDSGIFSNDYQYDYEVDKSGNEKYFRYEVDDNGNMKEGTKVYVNDLGTPLDPTERETESSGSNINPDKKVYGAFNKAKHATGAALKKAWNFSVGGAIKKKHEDKMQPIINAKAEWDQRSRQMLGSDDETDENITYRNDFFGNPIKWVKDRSGRWQKDDADGQNKKYDEETTPLKKGFNWITDKLGNLAGDIKDGIFSLFRVDEKDGTMKKFFKFALGGLGILTAAGAANVLEDWWDDKAKPAIHDFWSDKIMPRIQQYIEPIKPTLARAAVGIDKAINSIPTAIDNLGNKVRGFIINDLPRVWASKIIPFYKGGIDWLGEKAEKVTEGATYLMIKLLPSILKGVVKGGWNLLKGDIFNLFGGLGRRDSKSLMGSSFISNASSFKIPDSASNTMESSSPMQNIYSSIFGSSAKTDSGYAGLSSGSVSDSSLEDYYGLKTDSYPRNTNSSANKNSTGFDMSGVKSSISNTITKVTGKSFSNNYDYSGYAENIMSNNPIQVDNSISSEYDKQVATINNSKSTTRTSSPFNPSAPSANQYATGNSPYVYNQDSSLYYNNGDGTYTNMDTSEIVNSEDVNEEGSGFGKNSVGALYATAFGKALLRGRSGIWGALGRSNLIKPKNAAKTVYGKLFNGFRHTANAGFRGLDWAANFAGKNKEAVREGSGIYNEAAQTAAKATSKVGNETIKIIKGRNGVNFGVINGGSGETNAIDNAVNAATGNSDGIIKKFFKKIDTVVEWLYSKTIKKATGKALKEAGKDASQSAIKNVLDAASSKISNSLKGTIEALARKAPQKLASVIGKFIPFIDIAFFIADFLDGFNYASTYLGILDEDVSFVQRLICGIAQLVNGVVTLGLIPLSTIIDMFTEVLMPLFGMDTSELKEMQKEAGAQLSVYNQIHGTDYDLEDYNKRDSFLNNLTGKYDAEKEADEEFQYRVKNYQKEILNNSTSSSYQIDTDKYLYNEDRMSKLYNSIMNDNGYVEGNGSGLISNNSYLPAPISRRVVANGSRIISRSAVRTNKPSQSANRVASYANIYANGSGLPSYTNYSANGTDTTSTSQNLIELICLIVGINETNQNYGAINRNDGGSMSIGKYQFNGRYDTNAKALLKRICNNNSYKAKEILGEELYNKFSGSKTIKGFVPDKKQALAIGNLLISDEGKQAQDEFMIEKAKGYITSAQKLGISDAKAVIYFADMCHQGGIGKATKIVKYVLSSGATPDLYTLYTNTPLADKDFYTKFKERRDRTYTYAASSAVTTISTTGYTLKAITSGYSYIQSVGNSEDIVDESGSWLTKLYYDVAKAGKNWLGLGERKRAESETEENQDFGMLTEQNTEYSDSAYSTKQEKLVQAEADRQNEKARKALDILNSNVSSNKAKQDAQKIVADDWQKTSKYANMMPSLYSLNTGYSANNPFAMNINSAALVDNSKSRFESLNKQYPDFNNIAYMEMQRDADGNVNKSLNTLHPEFGNIAYLDLQKGTDKLLMEQKKLEKKGLTGTYKEYLNLWKKYSDNKFIMKGLAYKKHRYDELKAIDKNAKETKAAKKAFNDSYKRYKWFSTGSTEEQLETAWDKYYAKYLLDGDFQKADDREHFLKSANGSGFISQLDPRYAYNRIGNDTVAKAGCGPATAAMAIDGLSGGRADLMNTTTALAQKYKDAGGVKASYFADVLGRAGARTQYLEGANSKSKIERNLSSGKQVVLMGQDASNRSKANSPFGPGNHYVLAKGLSGNKVLINDPELSGPKVYDKSILNNTKLGIAVSGRGSESAGSSLFDKIYSKISSAFGGREYTEIGDAGVNEDNLAYAANNGTVVSGNAANIINYARSFMGRTKYSQKKREMIDKDGSYADCSSFVRHVFGKFGVKLGTYTGTQVYDGIEVSYNDLVPGDLVMFKNTCKTSNPRHVTHVGIYEGNGRFIHCSSGKNGVVESNLTDKYYQEHWLCGRRVINDTSTTARGSMLLNALSAEGSNIKYYKPSGTTATITNAISRAESARASSILSNNPITPFKNASDAGDKVGSGNQTSTGIDDTVANKLLATMVRLLGQIVDNTDNTKDIVKLLTQILEKAEGENESSKSTQTAASGSNNKNNRSVKSGKTSVASSAKNILKEYSQSDKADINSLINDLTTILRD